jgi:hypothetical protein
MRMHGGLLKLLSTSEEVVSQRTMNSDGIQTYVFEKYTCENTLQGGGWLLVRRVKQGATWHPATDNLAGTETYGIYGSDTADSTFSIAYSSWLTTSTKFMFATGVS